MPSGALARRLELSEQRKIVTVLFCDLTGSTALEEALDSERLRALLGAPAAARLT